MSVGLVSEDTCSSFVRLLVFGAAVAVTFCCPNNPTYELSAVPFSLISYYLSKYLADNGVRNMSPVEEDMSPPDLRNKIFVFNESAAFLRSFV